MTRARPRCLKVLPAKACCLARVYEQDEENQRDSVMEGGDGPSGILEKDTPSQTRAPKDLPPSLQEDAASPSVHSGLSDPSFGVQDEVARQQFVRMQDHLSQLRKLLGPERLGDKETELLACLDAEIAGVGVTLPKATTATVQDEEDDEMAAKVLRLARNLQIPGDKKSSVLNVTADLVETAAAYKVLRLAAPPPHPTMGVTPPPMSHHYPRFPILPPPRQAVPTSSSCARVVRLSRGVMLRTDVDAVSSTDEGPQRNMDLAMEEDVDYTSDPGQDQDRLSPLSGGHNSLSPTNSSRGIPPGSARSLYSGAELFSARSHASCAVGLSARGVPQDGNGCFYETPRCYAARSDIAGATNSRPRLHDPPYGDRSREHNSSTSYSTTFATPVSSARLPPQSGTSYECDMSEETKATQRAPPSVGRGAAYPPRPPPLPKSTPPQVLQHTQVFSAARHGRHKEVEQYLKEGFNPEFADQHGNTLFHIACQNGNKRIAKIAIKHGGDMNAQNTKRNTGMHFLVAYGYAEIADYFIEKGADGDLKNEAGLTCREGLK